jgi:pyrroline-5-carboxylate reductase
MRVLLVGCGKMGHALLSGWIDRGIDPAGLAVVEPGPDQRAAIADLGVGTVASEDRLDPDFRPDVVLLAVKPQMLADTIAPYRRFGDAVFLSIAAGKPLSFFADHLGTAAAVVRAMPNTPAAIRRGMTVCVANANVKQGHRADCQTLLEAVGDVAWIGDEGLMDAVTAVSGSGPAYVFLLAETLAAAGIKAGLPADLAAALARATVSGAGQLLGRGDAPPDLLRRNVTSPGGTTQAALDVLMADGRGMAELMEAAVAAAARRGRELAG